MTFLEKKSFYSFLGLYIISSTIFILTSAYWYYSAQEASLRSNDYYKLEHKADTISRGIITSYMQGKDLPHVNTTKLIRVALIDTEGKIVRGSLVDGVEVVKEGYFIIGDKSVLISSATQEHHNIKYVVVQSFTLDTYIYLLKTIVISTVVIVILLMIILAWILSKLFMRPINQKIKQIEDFISDTAHELNTPITALRMSVSNALSKEACDKKSLKNISISTKQLFDIYNSLSYLSFEENVEEDISKLDLCIVLEKSISYYEELAQRKRIEIILECESYEFKIADTKLTMLFGNLINNAIKYSHANSKIEISLKDGVFKIQDYGIGISQDSLSNIFERFNRETDYSGGFGIGLSIVQKISNEYDLKLNVESELEKGSCFIISFK